MTDELLHDMEAHILAGGFGIYAEGCELCEEAREAGTEGELFKGFSWTQPICTDDWVQQNHKPDPEGIGILIKTPTKVKQDEFTPEMCAFCGRLTSAGIFVREDPGKVLFPARKGDPAEPHYETIPETDDEREAANGNGIEDAKPADV